MDEKIKAGHRLAEVSETGPDDWPTFRWLCKCGEHDHGYVSEGGARDAHAAHVQELGVPKQGVGFEVVDSMHGPECDGCQGAARSAADAARETGEREVRWGVSEPYDPWEDPKIAHSAAVRRVEV